MKEILVVIAVLVPIILVISIINSPDDAPIPNPDLDVSSTNEIKIGQPSKIIINVKGTNRTFEVNGNDVVETNIAGVQGTNGIKGEVGKDGGGLILEGNFEPKSVFINGTLYHRQVDGNVTAIRDGVSVPVGNFNKPAFDVNETAFDEWCDERSGIFLMERGCRVDDFLGTSDLFPREPRDESNTCVLSGNGSCTFLERDGKVGVHG